MENRGLTGDAGGGAAGPARWWVYQRERFPIFAHGALIAAFSASAVCYSALVRGADRVAAASLAVAFGTAFLFFLQLRIADEFKDFAEDARFRPYRPVPRGLVSLRELGVLGGIAACLQLGLALGFDARLVPLLLLTLGYLALMSVEFFAGEWLRRQPFLYMASHMAIMPLIDFYATACDWLPAGAGLLPGLAWFLLISYFNGMVIEIGRKIRAPADEEQGVETYSVAWGRRGAVAAWLAAMVVCAAFALAAAREIRFVAPVAGVLAVLLVAAIAVAATYLRAPHPGTGKRFELVSGLWTLAMYLSVGVVPLVVRWWSGA
jgi:4-hydroxybenzoate polyprenyltransferase